MIQRLLIGLAACLCLLAVGASAQQPESARKAPFATAPAATAGRPAGRPRPHPLAGGHLGRSAFCDRLAASTLADVARVDEQLKDGVYPVPADAHRLHRKREAEAEA